MAKNDKKQITLPKDWTDDYSGDDIQTVIAVIGWLNKRSQSQAYMARLSRVKPGTLSRVLSGDYPSSPSAHIEKINQAIMRIDTKEARGEVPFVETSVYQLAESVCNRAREYGDFGVLSGYVGIGKTYSLKHYQATHTNTVLVESDPDLTPGALLNDLIEASGAMTRKTANTIEKFRAVVDALKGSDTLLIIDEAETMQPRTLHYLRRIRDKAGVGIVLSGTEYLLGLIKPHHGQFDQVRSRTPFMPATVKSISLEDSKLLAEAGLGISDGDILNRLWQYSQGSARVLTEGLIPAIKDFGLNKGHELSVALIDSVATKALGFKLIK